MRQYLGLAVFVTLVTPAPTLAQEDSLPEIVVTAQKREERLRDVPMSLSAIDADALLAENAVRIEDYFARIPGFSATSTSAGRVSLAVRGVTTGTGNNPTVGVTIDDVPIGSSTGIGYGDILVPELDPATLERIEVLRGPQGTLYGASSLGGLLKYVTARPRMNTLGGRLEADASTLAHGGFGRSVRGMLNLPIVDDRLAMRVNAFHRHDPGYVDDPAQGRRDVNDADIWGGRASLLWQPSDSISVRLSALYQRTQGDGSSEVDSGLASGPTDGLVQQVLRETGYYDREQQLYDASVSVDLGGATLTSITAYSVGDYDSMQDMTGGFGFLAGLLTGLPDAGAPARIASRTRKFSQELRVASDGDGPVEWLAGVFYTREKTFGVFDLFASDSATGEVLTPIFLDRYPTGFKERAVFGTATWHLGDAFDIQIGGRYSRNRQTFDETISGPVYDPPYVVDGRSKDSSFTYVLSPRWRVSPALMLYGRIASGYRPGGPNPGAGFGFPAQYDADETINYEIGAKGGLLDRRVSYDVAVYDIEWNDIQLRQNDPDTGLLYYTNAAGARSRGFEMTVNGRIASGVRATATLGHTDAELTGNANGNLVAGPGDPLPYAAKWNGSLSLDREFPIGADVQGSLGATMSVVGRRFGEFPGDPLSVRRTLPGYTTFDLRAGAERGGWSASLFVRNLTDRRGVVTAGAEAGGAPGFILNIIRPRTIGMSVARTF